MQTRRTRAYQLTLFPEHTAKFPSTRYQGSKAKLKRRPSEWTDKKRIHAAFDRLFNRYQRSIIVVSYRSDGIPSESELVSILQRYKRVVRSEHFGHYKYVLSTNSKSEEIFLVGV